MNEPDRQDRLDEILRYFEMDSVNYHVKGKLAEARRKEAKAEIENLYVSKEKIRQKLPEKHELLGSNDETNYDIGKSNGYNQAIKDISERLGL